MFIILHMKPCVNSYLCGIALYKIILQMFWMTYAFALLQRVPMSVDFLWISKRCRKSTPKGHCLCKNTNRFFYSLKPLNSRCLCNSIKRIRSSFMLSILTPL